MSKNLYVKLQFVALHQDKPSDYGAKLQIDGIAIADKYAHANSDYDPGGVMSWFDYAEFGIAGATWTRPDANEIYRYASYSIDNGTDSHLVWRTVTVPDDFRVPNTIDLGTGTGTDGGSFTATWSDAGSIIASQAFSDLKSYYLKSYGSQFLDTVSKNYDIYSAVTGHHKKVLETIQYATNGSISPDAYYERIGTYNGNLYVDLTKIAGMNGDFARSLTSAATLVHGANVKIGASNEIAFTVSSDYAIMTRGNDTIASLEGNDFVIDFEGNDLISLGDGNDTAFGGMGNDSLRGGSGDDVMYGNAGNDDIFDSSGNGTVFGGQGDDFILSTGGNDVLYGNMMSDTIWGGDGIDAMFGGQGGDFLYGGNGNDALFGNLGNDKLSGGYGTDHFYIGRGGGSDYVEDFMRSENDKVVAIGMKYTITAYSNGTLIDFGGGDQIFLAGVYNVSSSDIIT